MNADAEPYEPTVVKEALCKYFNMPSDRSQLTIEEKHFRGLGGPQIHYYHLTLRNGKVKRCAFAKTTPNYDREYRALQYLMKTIPEERRDTSRPIAFLTNRGHSLLILEYLEGYSSPLSILNSLCLFPNRALNITKLGKAIVDKIYDLQKHFPADYTPLSFEDIDELPGQPLPISVFKQLESIESISTETKTVLRNRIRSIVNNRVAVRRGVVHGQMGLRNIMIRRSNILFIDWEYMQAGGLCLYDPCYLATMLLMRSVQLFVCRFELDVISDCLFNHIKYLEEEVADARNQKFIEHGLWFAKCVAMVDTLWAYEAAECGWSKAFLGQLGRKIKYLAYHIEKDAVNGGSSDGSPL
jgi:hypothetical protein